MHFVSNSSDSVTIKLEIRIEVLFSCILQHRDVILLKKIIEPLKNDTI